jgi:hypothetical protein
MAVHTMTSREFNQDVGAAKKAAHEGPVFVTDRGRPAHVLLTYEQYEELVGSNQSIVDLIAMPPEVGDIEFEPTRLVWISRDVDLD